MNNVINVAIDGPAGAGKSTVARAAAKEIGFIYVDTGALYRAVGVNALRKGIDTKDKSAVAASLSDISVDLVFENGEQKVLLNGENVSVEIRTPPASMAASDVSAVPEVRAFLFDLQRDIAKRNSCIMDGRDIGTVVLPDAKVKIFLTASPEERATRRYKELIEKGTDVKYEDVLSELIERDYNDSHREIAPLRPAEDGVILDTTGLSLDESVNSIIKIIKENI
ncbi:MAG: (d)CMP kinase [Acutalibacteraceae bacterium]|nr:(d)CMP kinase [Acutalibacteraceae bacterium]